MRLVFDLGATKTRLALVDDHGKLGRPVIMATDPAADGYRSLIGAAVKLAGNHAITAVAGGAAGVIDREHGVILHSPNLPNWHDVPLAAAFRESFGAELALENDTAVVGLGEAVAGSGTRKGIMAYVTVSTGVNGVRIVDGVIDRSTYGFELDREIIVVGDTNHTLEELIGGRALQERYGRLPKTIDDPAVWREEAHYLAIGLYNLMVHWSPELIVLGGSMMRDIPLATVEAELQALEAVFPSWPRLVPAGLGDRGGLVGAAVLLEQPA